MIFKKLNSKEEIEYRLFARNNYYLFTTIPGTWHPIIQEECLKMNLEKSKFVKKSKYFVNEKVGFDKNHDHDLFARKPTALAVGGIAHNFSNIF